MYFTARFVSQLVLALAPFISSGTAQSTSSFVGTWASGAKNVLTGAGFANPAQLSFSYPKTTGISYSFTSDGFYEISRYRFVSNGTSPNCIIGVVNWVHGTYTELSNGSIVTTPFGDGYQQIQNPCVAQSNFIENYNLTEIYQYWAVNLDPVDGYKLQLYQFDGSPLAPQFLISTSPSMLPTRLLRNTTGDNVITVTSDGLVTTQTVGSTLSTNGAMKMTGAALGVGLVGLIMGLAGASLL